MDGKFKNTVYLSHYTPIDVHQNWYILNNLNAHKVVYLFVWTVQAMGIPNLKTLTKFESKDKSDKYCLVIGYVVWKNNFSQIVKYEK